MKKSKEDWIDIKRPVGVLLWNLAKAALGVTAIIAAGLLILGLVIEAGGRSVESRMKRDCQTIVSVHETVDLAKYRLRGYEAVEVSKDNPPAGTDTVLYFQKSYFLSTYYGSIFYKDGVPLKYNVQLKVWAL